MKKIAIFANNLGVGGIQKSLYNLLNNLDLNKYSIDLYLMDNKNFYNDKISKKINIIYLKKYSKFLKLVPFKLLMKFIKYSGNNINYDIAIDYDGYQQITAINTLKCNAKTKIMWVHNDFSLKYKYEKKYRLSHLFSKGKNKLFDKYVFVSKGIIEPFKKLNKIEKLNSFIIPNIIDTDEIIRKSKESCDINVDDNLYNFCSLGRVSYAKGFDLTLNYLKELTKFRQDFHYYLIGDGEEMDNIKNIIQNLNLEAYVTLLGLQSNPYKYLKLMDGFILNSRFEGQGMVLLEAKTLGLELFVSKNLELYNDWIKGYDNILEPLKKAKKKDKKTDKLEDYNNGILLKLDNLFADRN